MLFLKTDSVGRTGNCSKESCSKDYNSNINDNNNDNHHNSKNNNNDSDATTNKAVSTANLEDTPVVDRAVPVVETNSFDTLTQQDEAEEDVNDDEAGLNVFSELLSQVRFVLHCAFFFFGSVYLFYHLFWPSEMV